MELPYSYKLDVGKLASCFNNTSATYKFYWLLSLVQATEQGKEKIQKKELFARMIANAWFTVKHFNVSFGKSDILQKVVKEINHLENLTIDESQEAIFQSLLASNNPKVKKQLNHFDKNVPHWFLTPWFPKQNKETSTEQRQRIYRASQVFEITDQFSKKEEIEFAPICPK